MQFLIGVTFLLPVIRSQVYENELPVSLQPPPPQDQPKADFGSIIISDIETSDSPAIQQSHSSHLPSFQQPDSLLPIDAKRIAHRAVLQAAEQEAKLPPNLLNPFYKNSRIAEQLAKQSWFEPGETNVDVRDTEKIPRNKIHYALTSAGLIRRRRR